MIQLKFFLILILINSIICHYSIIDNYEYFISSPNTKNWHMASKDCAQRGMYLIDIPQVQEEFRLMKLIIRNGGTQKSHGIIHFWTSGTDHGSEGNFYWSTTGSDISVHKSWSHGQPDNGQYTHNGYRENCIALHSDDEYQWHDRNCNELNYYICRNETNPVQSNDDQNDNLLYLGNMIFT